MTLLGHALFCAPPPHESCFQVVTRSQHQDASSQLLESSPLPARLLTNRKLKLGAGTGNETHTLIWDVGVLANRLNVYPCVFFLKMKNSSSVNYYFYYYNSIIISIHHVFLTHLNLIFFLCITDIILSSLIKILLQPDFSF